ncbi:hypothetical protein [Halosegnis marinus]|uniref:Uncharacterized protein n=1 Tax=Halosegnis marinus TaxID=3034023 RepID=A0ABD5ZPE3_9EURY|nr:hypothetical protein [Halosegnis sp. DT85]
MDDPLTAEALADYCETQAGLLAGRIERLGEEAEVLLDDADADIAAAREGDATEDALADIEETQALVEAKRARMAAFRDLAARYADLAGGLPADPEAALDRVLALEREHDAPAYFEERETLLETAARGEQARD